jgi:hypothetical protein
MKVGVEKERDEQMVDDSEEDMQPVYQQEE